MTLLTLEQKASELVNDIMSLGTDHPNDPPAPQDYEQAVQQLLSLVQEEKANELELHRGEAITGGKAGIVMSYEEVEDRLQALKQPKGGKR